MYKALILATILAIVFSAGLDSYNVDITQSSTSGISAGGYMAVQFQVAYSSNMVGAGIVAGGPYMCAQGQLMNALLGCMSQPTSINLNTIQNKILKANKNHEIDELENMERQNVYLFSGTNDKTVRPGVMSKLEQQYENMGVENIVTEFDIPAAHAWITDDFGSKCEFAGSPYMNNCDYDQAEQIFKTVYGEDINDQVEQISANLIKFDQSKYTKSGDSMGKDAYVYVPTACQDMEECKIHIAFHGCQQTLADIGTKFVENSGLNGWAEANNIIVLYPQAKKSTFSPSNPNGCFDWWGYTQSATLPGIVNIDYATKKGKQMQVIWDMVTTLAGDKIEELVE